MRIYITHCSAKKDNSLKNTGRKVTPDELYIAIPTKRFMINCKRKAIKWAILSDLYGIWFPGERHEWYEKDPNTVTEKEFSALKRDFDEKLGNYDEIYFYHNPGRFHRLYKRLVREVRIAERIVLFSHIKEIV